MTAELVKNAVKGIGQKPLTLLGLFTEHNEEVKARVGTDCMEETFGTHITLSMGVPIETVSRMMGHKSISTTQIYAKVTDKKVDEDMKQLKERTKGKIIRMYEEDTSIKPKQSRKQA